MSTRCFIGLDATGKPMIRIMADSSYDPLTTPDTDYEKSRFNSRNTEYSYIDDIISWPLGVTTYYPAGSNSSNYVIKNENNYVYCHVSRAIAYYGFLPLILHRNIDISTGNVRYFRNDTVIRGNPYSMAKLKLLTGIQSTPFFDNSNNHPDELVSGFPLSGASNLSIVTKFPCDRDYTALTGTPVSGDCFMSVDEPTGRARVARGGFDARTAAKNQCMIHEDQRPITTVAQGFAVVPGSSTVTVPIGVDTPDGSFPFLIGATGLTAGTSKMASFAYPSAGFVLPDMAFDALVVGDDLLITNNSPTTSTLYYVVMVQNGQAPTTGGAGKILATDFDEIKMMRPGAAVPPVPADILLWSEYKYCPLVAYGKVPYTSFVGSTGSYTECTYDLTIPVLANPPIILCSVQKVGANADCNDGDIVVDGRYTSVFFGLTLSMSCWWQYDANTSKITFSVIDTDNGAGSGWLMRYYILAVPN